MPPLAVMVAQNLVHEVALRSTQPLLFNPCCIAGWLTVIRRCACCGALAGSAYHLLLQHDFDVVVGLAIKVGHSV